MHRTAVGDLDQSLALFFIKRATQFELPFDMIDLTGLAFTVFTIDRVNFLML